MHILDKLKKAMEQGFVWVGRSEYNVNEFDLNYVDGEYKYNLLFDGFHITENDFSLEPPPQDYTLEQIIVKYWELPLHQWGDCNRTVYSSFFGSSNLRERVAYAMGYIKLPDGKWAKV